MSNDSHRVISISLNEQEWQAFVRLHPQPVVWLRQKIQESLAGGADAGVPNARTERVGVESIASASAVAAANTTSATTR